MSATEKQRGTKAKRSLRRGNKFGLHTWDHLGYEEIDKTPLAAAIMSVADEITDAVGSALRASILKEINDEANADGVYVTFLGFGKESLNKLTFLIPLGGGPANDGNVKFTASLLDAVKYDIEFSENDDGAIDDDAAQQLAAVREELRACIAEIDKAIGL